MNVTPWHPRAFPDTEPRHDTDDPAWEDAMTWLAAHPEYESISSAVLSAWIASARNERRKLEGRS